LACRGQASRLPTTLVRSQRRPAEFYHTPFYCSLRPASHPRGRISRPDGPREHHLVVANRDRLRGAIERECVTVQISTSRPPPLATTQLRRCASPPHPAPPRQPTSLLLDGVLATTFLLLYTSVCRDISDSRGPPRWEQRWREAEAAGDGDGQARGSSTLVSGKQQQGPASLPRRSMRGKRWLRAAIAMADTTREQIRRKGRNTTDNRQQQPQHIRRKGGTRRTTGSSSRRL
jgi:hypothetical protein